LWKNTVRRFASRLDLLGVVVKDLVSLLKVVMRIDDVAALGIPSASFEELLLEALILSL
jgi:hypothetical protein